MGNAILNLEFIKSIVDDFDNMFPELSKIDTYIDFMESTYYTGMSSSEMHLIWYAKTILSEQA